MQVNTVVVGANRGIGLALCRRYSELGARVTGVCRSSSAGLEGATERVVKGVDISDAGSVERLREALTGERIDILVNCAGIMRRSSLEAPDFEGIVAQFEVNALGALRVSTALLPMLADGAKIAVISSRMGSIADNSSGGSYGYRMSKAALNAAARSLALDLAPRNISVAILHPGFVSTDMVGGRGEISPEESARGLVSRIDELNVDNSGTFWHQKGDVLPW